MIQVQKSYFYSEVTQSHRKKNKNTTHLQNPISHIFFHTKRDPTFFTEMR